MSLNHPKIKSPSSKPVINLDELGSKWEDDGAYSIRPKNNKTLKVPIGRKNVAASGDFISTDLNRVITVDTTAGNIALNIPDSFGQVGDWIVVKKKVDANDFLATAIGTDILEGDSRLIKKESILHLMKMESDTWHATGGTA